jgi:PAS domain S-box-containing protein
MEFVSNGCEVLTGYQADELIHNRVISYGLLIHPTDAPKIHEVISRAVSRHVQFRVQYRVLTKDGKYRWASEQGTGVYDDAGNPIGIEGFIIDITRQKILDDQVKTTQNRLNLLFAHMNAGCAIFSHNGSGTEYQLVDMNSAAEQIEKRKKEELIGKTVSEYFKDETADPIRDAFSSIITDHQPRSLKQIPYETGRGRIWIDLYLFISKTHKREVFVIYSNITDRVEDEERIITSLHEKETLLKEVHHRVKNNLQIISGILKLQSYRTTDQDAQNIIQECRNQVYSMASIHELLYNSKDIGKIRVSDYVEQLLDHLKQEYGAATSRITFIHDVDRKIVLDIERCIPCGLILNELITNAVKYAFEPGCVGEVRVSFRKLDQMFEMRVTDNGKGFPKDFDVSKTKTLGTELIVRLTRQLKGKIHLGPGPGTDVVVVFPDKPAGGITGNE